MRIASLLTLAAFAAPVAAQCTPSTTNFCVTLGLKTPANPNPGGSLECYYIDGVESPELTLERGGVYTFKMNNVNPVHPFYLCRNAIGGFATPPYTLGVFPTSVSSNQTMTFTVSPAAPATLFYGCENHEQMGWRINIIDPASCYANCDESTTEPILNVADFTCFLQQFAAGNSYANCDESTTEPVLNVADFTCFLQSFAKGCE